MGDFEERMTHSHIPGRKVAFNNCNQIYVFNGNIRSIDRNRTLFVEVSEPVPFLVSRDYLVLFLWEKNICIGLEVQIFFVSRLGCRNIGFSLIF